MLNIKFQNQLYKVREIALPKIGNVLISTEPLNDLLFNERGQYVSEEAIAVDERIYYFVTEKEIEFNTKRLKNFLIREVE